jgi:hypothetical protein
MSFSNRKAAQRMNVQLNFRKTVRTDLCTFRWLCCRDDLTKYRGGEAYIWNEGLDQGLMCEVTHLSMPMSLWPLAEIWLKLRSGRILC